MAVVEEVDGFVAHDEVRSFGLLEQKGHSGLVALGRSLLLLVQRTQLARWAGQATSATATRALLGRSASMCATSTLVSTTPLVYARRRQTKDTSVSAIHHYSAAATVRKR